MDFERLFEFVIVPATSNLTHYFSMTKNDKRYGRCNILTVRVQYAMLAAISDIVTLFKILAHTY